MMISITAKVISPKGIRQGLVVDDGRILEVTDRAKKTGKDYDFGDCLAVPGFIDIHMHGLGKNNLFEVQQIVEAAEMQVKFGTTGFLPTAASLAEQGYIEFAKNVSKAEEILSENNRSAKVLGAHFEGPFINPEGKGGMDENYLRPVDLQECQRYINEVGSIIKLVTLSPELKGSDELIRLLCKNDIVASIGHSRATIEQLKNARQAGLSHVCHLYNTFERTSLIEGWPWVPGLLEEILSCDDLTCEVICDMHHVRPEYVKLAATMLGPDRFVAITDSLPGAGLPAGEYDMIDGRRFSTREGVARLVDGGVLVGSIITMDKAFANLVQQCDVDLISAAKFTSSNAARVVGIDEATGSIEPGKRADIAVLDSDFRCIATFANGEMVYGN